MTDSSEGQPTMTITPKEAKKLLEKAIKGLDMEVKVQLNVYVAEALANAIIKEMTDKGLVKEGK